ncbi:MAG: RNA-binding cell elongation regulator Jag/EloR [Bacillota bacterium]
MISIETTGKTVDEAIEKALKELQLSREDVDINVLDGGTKGFLGIIGGKEARVRATRKVNPTDFAKEFLLYITDSMKVNTNFEIEDKKDHYYINITGKNVGILIGRRGETLDALQYLTNLAVQRKMENRIRIILDVEGYRNRREQTLVRLANRLSEKVKRTQKSIILEPMNPHERRIIHTALQNKNGVETYSQGEEPYRKVVISLRK